MPLKYLGHTATKANADLDALWTQLRATSGFVVTPEMFNVSPDETVDAYAAIQAAFDALPTSATSPVGVGGGTVLLGPRAYRVSQSIVPPAGYSFVCQGSGETITSISPMPGTPNIAVFNLSNLTSGPSRIFRDLAIAGANFGLQQSTGILGVALNALQLDHVWMAGLLFGVDFQSGSYFHAIACTAEYCAVGFNFRAGAKESQIIGQTYYHNTVDIRLDGDCRSFLHAGSNHIGTITAGFYLHGALGPVIRDVTASDADGNPSTPNLVWADSGTTRCIVDGVSCKVAGANVVLFDASCDHNTISNVDAEGPAIGVRIQGAAYNLLQNIRVSGATTAAVWFNSATYNRLAGFDLTGSLVGMRFDASEFTHIQHGSMATNANDFVVAGTAILYALGVVADFTAWATLYVGWDNGMGRRTLYGTAAPVGSPYIVGDRVVNSVPTVGQPKAWSCTVAGSPGTWVSEGNL